MRAARLDGAGKAGSPFAALAPASPVLTNPPRQFR